jgi:sigma-B regulation protein RsbU (phosphoserine phosphatase)
MAIVQSLLRAHPPDVVNPAGLLAHANRQLCGRQIDGFVTAFLGVYEPATRRLMYANAGHPPPLLKRASGASIRELDKVANFPLGIDAAETFEEATVQLAPDDTVLLYTDGIIEARGTASDDQFGLDRLLCLFHEASDQPAEFVERLRLAVRSHESHQPAKDDQAVVVARVL